MLTSELQSRYIATLVSNITLLFPTEWVREIVRIDRDLVLDLPFYDRRLEGVTNHRGKILPLLDARCLIAGETIDCQHDVDRFTIVCLNERAGNLAGLGIIVDRAIGSPAKSELPAELFASGSYESFRLVGSDALGDGNWQPQFQLTADCQV
jgi:hypothetical protein